MKDPIRFKLNGKPVTLYVEPERMLLWVLRTNLKLTGAKYGCGEGHCGACTVLVDEKAERACQMPIKNVNGKEVITIEGLANGEMLHPIQKAFMVHDALQCGFCTPGMILNAYVLLKETPEPSYSQIIDGMEDNLCRCGAHNRIVQAIQSAADEMKGGMK
jgi:aerobic-type carbon monoxide dehydrogenase small subunit (CoxS/CutS family)